MHILTASGGVLVAAGLAGLGWCIAQGLAIRRAPPDPAAARALLSRMAAVNLASVGTAAIGLALVLAGLIL